MPYYIKKPKKKKEKPLPLFDKAGIAVKKKPDLKAKLDKEFSLFIRLRDAMPNGYFRCISWRTDKAVYTSRLRALFQSYTSGDPF